jgi:hypothetical protein
MEKIPGGNKTMKYHKIGRIYFKDDKMFLLIDGKEHVFQISQISEKLLHANKIEREKYEISPSGYGIHWPLIDEDISIDGLLGITTQPSKRNNKTKVETGLPHYGKGK